MVGVIWEFLLNFTDMEIFKGLEVLLKTFWLVAIAASIKPGLTTLQTFVYAKQVIPR